jgi:hypothetical protein
VGVKIAVIGNCQARPIAELLGKQYLNVEIVSIAIVHLLSDDDEREYDIQLQAADYIVSQSVADNYPCQFVRTSKLKEKYGDKVLSIPNLFYQGYNPDLQYIRIPGKGTLKGPLGDYHSKIIFKSWCENESLLLLSEKIDSIEYWRAEFSGVHESSLEELRLRELGLDVEILPDIKSNLDNQRLFHTFNHPSLYLLNMLVDKIALAIGLSSGQRKITQSNEPLNQLVAPISGFVMKQLDIKFSNVENRYKGLAAQLDGTFSGEGYYDSSEIQKVFYDLYSLNSDLFIDLKGS